MLVLTMAITISLFGKLLRRHRFMEIVLELIMMCLAGPSRAYGGTFENRIITLFCLIGIVLISSYQSLIISFMSCARYGPEINTLKQIHDQCLFPDDRHAKFYNFKTFPNGSLPRADSDFKVILIYPKWIQSEKYVSYVQQLNKGYQVVYGPDNTVEIYRWNRYSNQTIALDPHNIVVPDEMRDLHGYQITMYYVDHISLVMTFEKYFIDQVASRRNATAIKTDDLSKTIDVMPVVTIHDMVFTWIIPAFGTTFTAIIVPRAKPKPIVSILFDPFDLYVWITYLVLVLTMAITISLFGKLLGRRRFMEIVLELIMMCLAGPSRAYGGTFENRIITLFCLMGIVLVSSYQSLVISFMSFVRYGPQINTLEEIYERCLFQDNSVAKLFNFNEMRDLYGYQIVMYCEDYVSTVMTFDEYFLELIANKRNATVILTDKYSYELMDVMPLMNVKNMIFTWIVPSFGTTFLAVVVPRAKPKPIVSILIDPFDLYVWITYLVLVLTMAITISLFGKLLGRRRFMEIVLELIMMCLAGPSRAYGGTFENRIITLFCLMGIVLVSSYQSLIISFMSYVRYDSEINTLDEINEQCLFPDNNDAKFFNFKTFPNGSSAETNFACRMQSARDNEQQTIMMHSKSIIDKHAYAADHHIRHRIENFRFAKTKFLEYPLCWLVKMHLRELFLFYVQAVFES
uniref:Ionotropic glutamate receptor C-terminal domain-containing protein n=1 Tax=Anopheles quadriannulatus TaxID=34691 RepID=A0A182WT82_ANOQN